MAWWYRTADRCPGCYTQEGRAGFSGRMDVRVLSGVHCVACGILEADLANTMGPMAGHGSSWSPKRVALGKIYIYIYLPIYIPHIYIDL